MGWTSLGSGYDRRDAIDAARRELSWGQDCAVERSCLKGNIMWSVVRCASDRTIVVCTMLEGPTGGWAWKHVDETMGPVYHSCPVSYLDASDDPTEVYAIRWRENVREEAKRKGRKLTVGEVVKLIGARIPEVRITSLRPLQGAYGCNLYRIPRRLLAPVD